MRDLPLPDGDRRRVTGGSGAEAGRAGRLASPAAGCCEQFKAEHGKSYCCGLLLLYHTASIHRVKTISIFLIEFV